jgi:hypothetical protein
MMVGQFIDRLEQQGLLDKSVVDELRRKVAKAQGKKITPEAIARYLVDSGHLTRFQATRLINEITRSAPEAAGEPAENAKGGELRLAPEDRPPARTTPAAPATSPKPMSAPAPKAAPPPSRAADVVDASVNEGQWAEPAAVEPLSTLAGERESTGGAGRRSSRSPQRAGPQPGGWNAKLPILGGISLVVILLVGAFLYLSLSHRAAEKLLQSADNAYRDQAYGEAMSLYDDFVGSYSRHAKISLARVRRAMSYLLQWSKDPEQGMNRALEVLPQIEDEESFPDAHEELANVLPQIAAGFVGQALRAEDTASQEALLKKTESAMALVDDPDYVPAVYRKSQATTIESIMEDMARVRRKIGRVKSLNAALQKIDAAVAAGNAALAYAARDELLGNYLGFDSDPQLLDAMLRVTEMLRGQVSIGEQPLTPAADDPAANLPPHVVLAHRTGTALDSLAGRVVYTLAGGCVFALDGATGDVLWRRYVGCETTVPPQPLEATAAADAIAADQRRNELMRLEARTGKVVWHVALGEPFFEPVSTGQRIVVASASGKVYVVDAASGQAPRHVQIPQPLEVSVCRSARQPVLYQVAEQDNVYVLSADTLECREVFYLGHKRGTVTVPPVLVSGYLLIVENAGPGFSYLHVLKTDDQGLQLQRAQDKIRLTGQVLSSPAVAERSVLIVTDVRAAQLFDVAPQNPATGTPVVAAAGLDLAAPSPTVSYALLQGDRAWIAGDRLAQYATRATAGKLAAEWESDERDVYVTPLQMVGDAIIHVRQRRNAPGVTIAALRSSDKDPSWQTEVAVPAEGVFVQGDAIDVVTERGRLFRATAPDFERRTVEPAKAAALPDPEQVLTLTETIDCGNGLWAFSPAAGYHQLVFYQPGNADNALRLLTLAVPPGSATAPPVPMAGGLLVPLRGGSVVLIDPTSGNERMYAFHPSVPVGVPTVWSRPVVLDDGQEFVIANNHRVVFHVGIKDKADKELAALSARPLDNDVVGPWAAVARTCCAVTRSGTEDAAVAYTLPDVVAAQKAPLSGRLLWGPQRVGDAILVATGNELLCLDSTLAQRWKMTLDHGPVIGQPLCVDTRLWLSAEDGILWQIDMATGHVMATVEVGEPLASGPFLYGSRLLVAGQCGVLFNVGVPNP